jgi:hypothetical protein
VRAPLDARILKSSDSQILRFSNPQILKSSDSQILRSSDSTLAHISAYAARRAAIGRTRCRWYATNVAIASNTRVMAAELHSARSRW